jgi:translation initiation factor 5
MKMITSERHQKALLGGTERFVGKDHPDKLIPQVPAILMAFYQEDVITEDVVKAWGSKASKKYVDLGTSKKVRKAAEKFLEWLENAQSEDEESEEEEEE